MPTFWVSTAGTDTNSGTNYADAVKTIKHGVNIATSVGDIVNVVNDGTHLMTSAASQYTQPAGTGWSPPGLTIQGTDSSGNPDKTTIAATTGQANQLIYMRGGAKYWLIQGFKFNLDPVVGSTTQVKVVRFRDNTAGPLRIRYCEFIGSTSTSWPSASRQVLDQVSTAATDFGDIAYCYLRNMQIPLNTQSTCGNVVDNCVIFNRSVEFHNPRLWSLTAAASTKVHRFRQNTQAMIPKYAGSTLLSAQALPYGWNVGAGNVYFDFLNNLFVIQNTTVSTKIHIGGVVGGVNASAATVNSTTYGYNYWGLCSNVDTIGSWNNGGIYQDPWSSIATGTGVDDVMATDVLTQNNTVGDLVQDYTGTYTWECTSTTAWHIIVPDLRAKVGTNASASGGQVGALPSANTAPIANPDTYATTAGETLAVTAGSGVLENDIDFEGDTLTASLVTDVGTGTLSLASDGSFTYVTDEHYNGTATFTYKAYDGITFSNVTTVTINIATFPNIDPDVPPPEETTDPKYLDVRPFFEPTLELRARMKITAIKNRKLWSDIRGRTGERIYSENTIRQLTLATNTQQNINMGGVETGEYLAVQSTNPVKIAVGNNTYFWPSSKFMILAGGNYSTLTLANESTTNDATVLLAIVD